MSKKDRRFRSVSYTHLDVYKRQEYSDLMQKSYIDYAMSVIIARALPDVRDGLKPVQRRTCLLYTSRCV